MKGIDKHTSASVLTYIFYVVGIWPLETNNKLFSTLHKMYRISVFVIELCYSLLKITYTYFIRTDLDLLAQSLFESIYIFILFLQFCTVVVMSKNFRYIICYMKNNFRFRDKRYSLTIVQSYMKRLKILFIITGLSVSFTDVSVLIRIFFPEFSDVKSNRYWNKTNPERKMPIPIWFPFDETVSPYYYFILILIFIAVLICSFFLFTFTVLIPTVLTEIGGQFQIIANILEYQIRECKSKSAHIASSTSTELTNFEVDGENISLKDAVEYHQEILIFFNYVSETFRIIMIMKSSFLMFAICLSTYQASSVPLNSTEIFVPLFYFFSSVLELFVFCWFSEQLTHYSTLVYRAAYFSQWHNCPEGIRKSFYLVAIRAKEPIKLELLPHFIEISLENFITVMKTSYSAYTLIQSFKTEQ